MSEDRQVRWLSTWTVITVVVGATGSTWTFLLAVAFLAVNILLFIPFRTDTPLEDRIEAVLRQHGPLTLVDLMRAVGGDALRNYEALEHLERTGRVKAERDASIYRRTRYRAVA